MTVSAPKLSERRWNADENRWEDVKRIIGSDRVTLGPQASQQWLEAPDHLAMVLARYRAAAALIGGAASVLEIGCGEGIGSRILAGRSRQYVGIDTDAEAVTVAEGLPARSGMHFRVEDALDMVPRALYGAAVALDVIEHIPTEHESAFLSAIVETLHPHGVCVIGTPSAAFEHLASPQSAAGHVNLYTHDRLRDLMARHFHVVQSFGLQDTSLHLGHPDARHYLLFAGIGPR